LRTEDVTMPSRWTCAAIIAFWLLINGWMFWREVLPDWEPNQPPTIRVDLMDEVQLDRQIQAGWIVSIDGQRAYRALTWVDHGPEKGVWDLIMQIDPIPPDLAEVEGSLKKMRSSCRITAAGELRQVHASVTVARPVEATMTLHGEVRERRFQGGYSLEVTDRGVAQVLGPLKQDMTFPPVDVSSKGTVLLAFHPLQRIPHLQPGQTWSVPTINFGVREAAVSIVKARVLPEPEIVEWVPSPANRAVHGTSIWSLVARTQLDQPLLAGTVPFVVNTAERLVSADRRGRLLECLVIDSVVGKDHTHTWVERDSGRVMRQESFFHGEHWMMQREYRDR
jgi:hypothetical protein